MDKQIKILERRLNHELVKYNEKIADNKKLREKIDERRRERFSYDAIYTNIERKLHESAMKRIIMEGCKAMKERDKRLSDVEALKQQVKETAESLQDDQRQLDELLGRNDYDKEKEGERRDVRVSTTVKTKTQREVNTAVSNVKPNPAAVELDLQCESGDDVTDDLASSIDVEAMLASFIEAEERKLSIFNHLSEMSIEKELIEKDILRANREIESLTRENLKSYKVSSCASPKIINRTEGKTIDYQEKHKTAEQVLSSLKAAIKDVYYQIKCDNFIPGANQVLGGAVTDSNIMQYLAIIEQRAAYIIQQYGNNKVNTTGEWPIFFTAAPEGRSMPFHIDPPDTDGEVLECFSTEDDDGRPLSAKELHLKIWS